MPPSRPPGIGTRIARIGLIGLGGSVIVSAVVNIVAAYQLIEPSDAESLGITRNQIFGMYGVLVLLGGMLVWLGLRRK